METVVYLARSPVEGVSPFLYSKAGSAIVIGLGNSSLTGTVLKSNSSCGLKEGVELSGKDLLELLVRSRRIITL